LAVFATASAGAIAVGATVAALAMYRGYALLGAAVVAALGFAATRRPTWLLSPGPLAWLMGLTALAAGLRLAALLLLPYEPHADFAVFHGAAANVAARGELVVWASEAGEFRAFLPPFQPLVLGSAYSLLGSRPLVGQLLNVIWGTGTVLGVWYLGSRLFGKLPGRVASLLAAMLPSAVFGAMLLGAEAPQTFWFVAALCVYVAAVDAPPEAPPPLRARRFAAALACGALLGVAALARPTFALVPLVLALHLLLAWRRRGLALALGLSIAIGAAAVIAPWTLRNRAVLGHTVIISTNGGGNLYSSNNPLSRGAYTDEAWRELYHRFPADEVAMDRYAYARACDWIRGNPWQFATLAAMRMGMFWYTDKEIAWWALEEWNADHPEAAPARLTHELAQGTSSGFYAAAIVAAWLGLRRRRDLRRWSAWMALPAAAIYFTMVHMVFESQCKYHYMLVSPLLALAALGLVRKRAGTRGNE
jgi:4-amino-4-deoxy-L-arabinose transferase-like glycosyltransferase